MRLAADRERFAFSPPPNSTMQPDSNPGYLYRRKCAASLPRPSFKLLLFSLVAAAGLGLLVFSHADNLPALPSSDKLSDWSIGFTQQQKSLLEEENMSQREQLAQCTRHAMGLKQDRPQIDADDVRTWPSPTPELPMDATLQERIAAWNETPVADAVHWAR